MARQRVLLRVPSMPPHVPYLGLVAYTTDIASYAPGSTTRLTQVVDGVTQTDPCRARIIKLTGPDAAYYDCPITGTISSATLTGLPTLHAGMRASFFWNVWDISSRLPAYDGMNMFKLPFCRADMLYNGSVWTSDALTVGDDWDDYGVYFDDVVRVYLQPTIPDVLLYWLWPATLTNGAPVVVLPGRTSRVLHDPDPRGLSLPTNYAPGRVIRTYEGGQAWIDDLQWMQDSYTSVSYWRYNPWWGNGFGDN